MQCAIYGISTLHHHIRRRRALRVLLRCRCQSRRRLIGRGFRDVLLLCPMLFLLSDRPNLFALLFLPFFVCSSVSGRGGGCWACRLHPRQRIPNSHGISCDCVQVCRSASNHRGHVDLENQVLVKLYPSQAFQHFCQGYQVEWVEWVFQVESFFVARTSRSPFCSWPP